MITESDFNDLRAKQVEMATLQAAEDSAAQLLTDLANKADRLQSSLTAALIDPRSTWEAVQNLQKQLAQTEFDLDQAKAGLDSSRQDRISALDEEVSAKVDSLVAATPAEDVVSGEPAQTPPVSDATAPTAPGEATPAPAPEAPVEAAPAAPAPEPVSEPATPSTDTTVALAPTSEPVAGPQPQPADTAAAPAAEPAAAQPDAAPVEPAPSAEPTPAPEVQP